MIRKIVLLTLFIVFIIPLGKSACVVPTQGSSYYGNLEICTDTYFLNDTNIYDNNGVLNWYTDGEEQILDGDMSTFYGIHPNQTGGSFDFSLGVVANLGNYNATIKNFKFRHPPPYIDKQGYISTRPYDFEFTIYRNTVAGGLWIDNCDINRNWWVFTQGYDNKNYSKSGCEGAWTREIGTHGNNYNVWITNSKWTCGVHGFGYYVRFHYVNVTGRNFTTDPTDVMQTTFLINVNVHDSQGRKAKVPVNVTQKAGDYDCSPRYGEGATVFGAEFFNQTIWTNESGNFDKNTLVGHQRFYYTDQFSYSYPTPEHVIEQFYDNLDYLELRSLHGWLCDGYWFEIDGEECYKEFHEIVDNEVIDIEIEEENCPSATFYGEPEESYYCGELGICTDNMWCLIESSLQFLIGMIYCMTPMFWLIFGVAIAGILLLGMKSLSKNF